MTIHQRFPFKWKKETKNEKQIDYMLMKFGDTYIPLYLFKEFLNKKIEVLDLSTRSYNALKRSSINTIEDMLENWERIPKIKCVGIGSVKEIHTKMFNYYVESIEEGIWKH